jgi:nitrogen-specific signal transduction histidine kinase/ActR/RegA family two-component response regulator
VPHESEDGLLFIGFLRDLTEQKKLNERLRQAQKMQAIGTLAGGIAHDFNNIIATISGNVVLAKAEAPAGSTLQESLAEIQKATDRATFVVRQILKFSSARETKAEVIDPGQTVEEALRLLRATIPSTIEIESNFEHELPGILADTTDIHQIVLNLGINAKHAMHGQHGKIVVQVTVVDLDEETASSLLNVKHGKFVRISFGDTGTGMDAETLNRVFEPFFTTKAPGEGTGLGLAVVYGIVESHHGAITVYSEVGKGTVFHIYFPAVEAAPKRVDRETRVDISGNGERILYVDDDEALVFLMNRMLKRLNYSVAAFQDSREALEAFRADPMGFDLVITDMSMPHLDGIEIVNALKEIRPDVPIVMVTGYIRPQDLEQTKNLGIAQLIQKPETAQEMSHVLHRILSDIRHDTIRVSELVGPEG